MSSHPPTPPAPSPGSAASGPTGSTPAPAAPRPGLKREFVVERQGRSFVLYAGLLDLAHERGLRGITTALVQVPNELNGSMAIVHATVEMEHGTFTGLGDATPQNVSTLMKPHLIRMAETRAKARALRDAVNVGATALEELGEEERSPEAPREERGEAMAEDRTERARAEARRYDLNEPATDQQRETIGKLARAAGQEVTLADTLTFGEAGQQIRRLQHLLNEQRPGSRS